MCHVCACALYSTPGRAFACVRVRACGLRARARLCACVCVDGLCLQGLYTLVRCTCVSLAYNCIGDAEVERVAATLPSNTTLKSLKCVVV